MRIGIAVDGSSSSLAGVELVSSLQLSGSDRISVISVAEPPTVLAPPVAGFRQQLVELVDQRAERFAEHAVERLVGLPCPVAAVVSRGHPVAVLTRLAEELDLGSVSRAVSEAAACSVLVVGGAKALPAAQQAEGNDERG